MWVELTILLILLGVLLAWGVHLRLRDDAYLKLDRPPRPPESHSSFAEALEKAAKKSTDKS